MTRKPHKHIYLMRQVASSPLEQHRSLMWQRRKKLKEQHLHPYSEGVCLESGAG